MVRVYLTKNIENVGLAGQIVHVKEGFATNYILPRKLGVVITPHNEADIMRKIKTVEHKKEVVKTKTSQLAERIKSLKVVYKTKTHDDGKLYGAVSTHDVVDLLAKEGVAVAKNQIIFEKPIKATGSFDVVIKLSNQLQPTLKLVVESIK